MRKDRPPAEIFNVQYTLLFSGSERRFPLKTRVSRRKFERKFRAIIMTQAVCMYVTGWAEPTNQKTDASGSGRGPSVRVRHAPNFLLCILFIHVENDVDFSLVVWGVMSKNPIYCGVSGAACVAYFFGGCERYLFSPLASVCT